MWQILAAKEIKRSYLQLGGQHGLEQRCHLQGCARKTHSETLKPLLYRIDISRERNSFLTGWKAKCSAESHADRHSCKSPLCLGCSEDIMLPFHWYFFIVWRPYNLQGCLLLPGPAGWWTTALCKVSPRSRGSHCVSCSCEVDKDLRVRTFIFPPSSCPWLWI